MLVSAVTVYPADAMQESTVARWRLLPVLIASTLGIASLATQGRSGISVPPRNAAVAADRPVLAIFITSKGVTHRLDLSVPGAPSYPEHMARLGIEDDVEVTCTTPTSCHPSAPSHSSEFASSALAAAKIAAPAGHSYPLSVLVSFRIVAYPRGIPHWAPSPCPQSGQARAVRQRLQHQLEITGTCYELPTRPH